MSGEEHFEKLAKHIPVKKLRARAAILLALLNCAGCHNWPTSAATAGEAIRVTSLYRAENFPHANFSGSAVETADLGDRWRVTYYLRGATGGISSYEVDKRSARIVRMTGGQ
jgi:hypothetical protein